MCQDEGHVIFTRHKCYYSLGFLPTTENVKTVCGLRPHENKPQPEFGSQAAVGPLWRRHTWALSPTEGRTVP